MDITRIFDLLDEIFNLYLIPLAFLPTAVLDFFKVIIVAFIVWLVCRLLKLIWDILPFV